LVSVIEGEPDEPLFQFAFNLNMCRYTTGRAKLSTLMKGISCRITYAETWTEAGIDA
jgi:hypothetical protein